MADGERLICSADLLADGGDGFRFAVSRYGREVPAFVIRFRGRAYAYLNQCTHVPVELDWQNGRFFDSSGLYLICATHGALYDPVTGACLGGRCNRKGLIPLAIIEHDGGIFISESEEKRV